MYKSLKLLPAVDAAYEGMQNLTFLVFALLHIPFVIEIILLYPKLGLKIEEQADLSMQGKSEEKKSLLAIEWLLILTYRFRIIMHVYVTLYIIIIYVFYHDTIHFLTFFVVKFGLMYIYSKTY